ncbi:hypothetical protein FRC10_011225 [Ceratobasidium sp. 414]|nr:hypothetical protein FRC10_011225 [Ceratobasidium sp. 414]
MKEFDILIIGATGYTASQTMLAYCITPSLRIALGGRTLSKVQALASESEHLKAVHVDVSDPGSVDAAVAQTRVVINLAGPYWTYGSTVVRYDYLAHKNGACIVPGSGFDSIPSDLAAYLSTQTLENRLLGSGLPLPLDIKSVAAHRFKGSGISGGTAATIINSFEEVPTSARQKGSGWGLSPVPGPPGFSSLPSILYSLPYTRPTIYGGFFPMGTANEPIVRRSWGLRQRQRLSSTTSHFTFSYHEFMRTRSAVGGIVLSLAWFMAGLTLALFPPAMWLAKRLLPVSGGGPPREGLEKGWFEVVNVSEARGMVVKSVVKGQGDPGYYATARMIFESALLLLDSKNLTPMGQEGGILTPATAFGDRLVQALEATGQFEASSEVLVDQESKKTS